MGLDNVQVTPELDDSQTASKEAAANRLPSLDEATEVHCRVSVGSAPGPVTAVQVSSADEVGKVIKLINKLNTKISRVLGLNLNLYITQFYRLNIYWQENYHLWCARRDFNPEPSDLYLVSNSELLVL